MRQELEEAQKGGYLNFRCGGICLMKKSLMEQGDREPIGDFNLGYLKLHEQLLSVNIG